MGKGRQKRLLLCDAFKAKPTKKEKPLEIGTTPRLKLSGSPFLLDLPFISVFCCLLIDRSKNFLLVWGYASETFPPKKQDFFCYLLFWRFLSWTENFKTKYRKGGKFKIRGSFLLKKFNKELCKEKWMHLILHFFHFSREKSLKILLAIFLKVLAPLHQLQNTFLVQAYKVLTK